MEYVQSKSQEIETWLIDIIDFITLVWFINYNFSFELEGKSSHKYALLFMKIDGKAWHL